MSLDLLLGPQLRAFQAAGWTVTTASAPGPEVERLRDWGIDHFPLKHATRAMAPHRDALALAELYRLFRRTRPDIVHTHNPKPGLYGRLAARAARVPGVVNTVHGLYAQPTDRWLRRTFVYTAERVAARCSDVELVQNVEDAEVLRRLGVPQDRLQVLGNGVDLARFDPARVSREEADAFREEIGVATSDVLVCSVGRLVLEKGYREILAAARAVMGSRSDVSWVVVGPADGDKTDAVSGPDQERASQQGMHFLGFRSDMPRVYAAADLFVTASYREGFPRAAMEAAAMGLPVVATDIRGCRQVVDDGLTGLLVPVRDADRLARAVADLAADAPRRDAMGAAARARAHREFDQQRVIERTLAAYDRLLDAGVPGGR
jgi:glycosyltransferase involved in cell wall biosynthesis